MLTAHFRYSLCLSLGLFISLYTSGQTILSGDLYDYVADIINALPGADHDDYTDPASSDIDTWHLALDKVVSADYAAADSLLADIGYRVVLFTDTGAGGSHVILEKTTAGVRYWGTYVLNQSSCRSELILMSPHPKKDLNTGKQGIYCYLQCDALGFMLAGTNRCNAPDQSSCSGTTSVCDGSSAPYRISDLAHSTTSIWQRTVAWLRDSLPGTYFVQLHGFAKQEDDPYVIMSNGTRETPYPDKIAALRDYLDIVDPVLTFRIAHEDLDWTRLLGFTNTNGRLLNASSDPCEQSADETSGRFLHIEQEKLRLRQDVSGWNKMARALAATFRGSGCPAVLPVVDRNIWYVREGTSGDGSSWSSANGYLRGVLHLADSEDSICIAAGTYSISLYDDPLEAMDLHDGITILGGFPEAGGNFGDRDWQLHQAIISGDLGTSGASMDNSECLLRDLDMTDTIIVDGVYLQNTAPSSSGALSLTGSGCVVLNDVSMTGLMNTLGVVNSQELIMSNVTINGVPGTNQVLISNEGTLLVESTCTLGQ